MPNINIQDYLAEPIIRDINNPVQTAIFSSLPFPLGNAELPVSISIAPTPFIETGSSIATSAPNLNLARSNTGNRIYYENTDFEIHNNVTVENLDILNEINDSLIVNNILAGASSNVVTGITPIYEINKEIIKKFDLSDIYISRELPSHSEFIELQKEYKTIINTNFEIYNNKINFYVTRDRKKYIINLFWSKSETKVKIILSYNSLLKRYIVTEKKILRNNETKEKKSSFEFEHEYIAYVQDRYKFL